MSDKITNLGKLQKLLKKSHDSNSLSEIFSLSFSDGSTELSISGFIPMDGHL